MSKRDRRDRSGKHVRKARNKALIEVGINGSLSYRVCAPSITRATRIAHETQTQGSASLRQSAQWGRCQ